MGVLNVTPDSFSGDGLLARRRSRRARPSTRRGGWSRTARTSSISAARRAARARRGIARRGGRPGRPGDPGRGRGPPGTPLSVDTTSVEVAAAALDAGAHLLNDIWGVADDPAMARLAAERGVPLVVMHNRAEPRYDDVVAEVVDDLAGPSTARERAGVAADDLIVDPGFGFGKTPDHNLALLAGSRRCARSGGRSCWDVAQVDPRRGCSTCPSTSASRRRSRPRPSGSARA